jgi:hypothetical protein
MNPSLFVMNKNPKDKKCHDPHKTSTKKKSELHSDFQMVIDRHVLQGDSLDSTHLAYKNENAHQDFPAAQ